MNIYVFSVFTYRSTSLLATNRTCVFPFVWQGDALLPVLSTYKVFNKYSSHTIQWMSNF